MSAEVKISFVVLTYNRSDALLQVLTGLALQCGEEHEVIIADDGSSAQVIETWVRAIPMFRCSVRHVWHPDKGFTASRARNLGAMSSRGKYLVFLDGDCIPAARFVKAHEALATEGCFVNGNRVLLNEQFTARVLSREIDIFSASWIDWLRWRAMGYVNKLAQLLYWPAAPFRIWESFHWKKIRSCNFAVWKDDFVKINGFDETFEGWGHEDADLVLRLHNAGLRRVNGYFCTEVYHLWHNQYSRGSESINYERVLSRVQSGLVTAVIGLQENHDSSDVVITPLN